MVVTKSDAKTEYGAVVFLKWFTEAQRNLDFSISSGYLPVKKEANTQDMLNAALDKEAAVSYTVHLKKRCRWPWRWRRHIRCIPIRPFRAAPPPGRCWKTA